jgi:ketosteroid isomerase-like protein
MAIHTIGLLVITLLMSGGSSGQGQNVTSQITQIEHQWEEALEKLDTTILNELLSDDFIDSTFRGAIRDKQAILTGPRNAAQYHSLRFDDLRVRSYGDDIAIATGINVLQGRTKEDIVRIRFTDVFVKQNHRWRAVSAQETLQAD